MVWPQPLKAGASDAELSEGPGSLLGASLEPRLSLVLKKRQTDQAPAAPTSHVEEGSSPKRRKAQLQTPFVGAGGAWF